MSQLDYSKVLRGHTHRVYSVSWSLDGLLLVRTRGHNMTKPFNELRKRMTPEQRVESEAVQANLALLHLTLSELRESLALTQSDVALDMGVVQSALSKIEHQEDIQISTLSRYIKSLGGSLTIIAHFPDREVVISQFD